MFFFPGKIQRANSGKSWKFTCLEKVYAFDSPLCCGYVLCNYEHLVEIYKVYADYVDQH